MRCWYSPETLFNVIAFLNAIRICLTTAFTQPARAVLSALRRSASRVRALCLPAAFAAALLPAEAGGVTDPYLGLNSPSVKEGDSGTTTLTFTARLTDANGRTQASAKTITAYYEVLSGSATAGTDFTAASGRLTFAPGETSKTIDVSVLGDTEVEGDETLTVKWTGWENVWLVSYTHTGTITNDDSAPPPVISATLTIADASAEEGDALSFSVALDNAVPGGLTVTPSFTDGTAASTDYTANTNALNFTGKAGETQTLSVSTTEDEDVEDDETFTVGLTVSGTTHDVTATDTAIGTIKNDDADPVEEPADPVEEPPTVDLAVSPSSVSEADSAMSVTVTATASSAVAVNTPVKVSIGGGTATWGKDYTAVAELELEIPAGGATGQGAFKLTPIDDREIEGKETISISGSASGLSVNGTSLTLTDKEEVTAQWWHGARLSVSPGSVSENGGKQLVTVTAEVSEWGTSTSDLSYVVTVGKGGDSAVSGTDYKAVSKFNVNIKAGRRSGSNSFNLEPIGDSAWEGDETITIHGSGTGGAQSTALTLTDEGDRPYGGPQVTLSANPSKVSEADGATTVTVTATSSAHSAARTVTVSVGGSGTATSGTDYAAVSDFTISLAKNATSATGTFTLTPTQDKLAEGDETIAVAGNVEGVTAKLTGTTLTMTDDEPALDVTLSVSPSTVSENGGAQTVTVTATSAVAAAKARTVLVAVGNRRKDTATPGTDYTVVPAFNITLPANATTATATFSLTPTNDTSVEDTESISIDGTPESGGANFTAGGAAMTLTDDDAQPAVTLTATPASVDEAALATSVTVKATAASAVAWARTVTVSVGKTGSAASGTDYAAVSNFDVAIAANATSGTGTFSLKPTQDTTNEGNETIGVAGTSLNTTVTGTTVTLADDDINPAVTLSVSPSKVSESASATSVTVTATATAAMTSARTVAVKVGGGTATSGTDYAAVSDFNITIAANATSGTGTFTLTPTNDTTVEGGETIGVAGSSTGTTVTGTTVALTDDDTYPAVTLSVSTSSLSESASATSITVTATAASAISSSRTVTVAVGQTGTASSGSDYAAVTDFDITIAANATSGTGSFTLTPTQDSAVEYNETIGVDGSSPNTTMTNATITLTDDDKDTVTLSLSRKVLGEEASGTSVTVTATAATAIAVARKVTVSVGNTGTATSGTDYAAVSDFDVTIAANATSGTGSFTLTPTQDSAVEYNETIGVAGTNSLSTVTGTTLTLVDDDQPTISLSAGTVGFAESWSGTINVTATRTGATTSAVDVTVVVGAGTDNATEGVDYTEVDDYTITIPAGQTSASKGFSVAGIRDIVADNNERFSINGLANGYKVNSVPDGVNIFEWYATIGLTTDVSSVSEHDGATTVTVTAHIHPTVYGNVYVTVSVGGGTATSGTDYAAVSNFTITIPNKASSATGTFTLTPTQDALLESDETININGSGSHFNFYAGRGTSMTLTDAQPISLSATPSSVSEGAPPTQVAVTATATGTVSTPRTLTVSVGGTGTATSGTDYAAVSDFDITIPANKTGATNTFTLTPTKDSAGEGDETIGVSGASTGTYVYPTTLTLTDTNPAVTLSASPSSISEGGSATTVTVTATASAALATARTVTVKVGGSGTATSGTDYAAVSDFTITIAANETSGTGTFTLTPTDDTALEGDETVGVTGTSAEAAAISHTTLTLTDDDLPTIALATVPTFVAVAEDGSRKSVTVRATAAAAMKAATTVTLDIGAGGDSATKTTDYTTSNVRDIVIPKGQSTAEASFELTPVEDTLVEGNEAVSVSGSSSGGHTVTGTSVTLTDDDRYRITLSASPSSVGEGASATSVTVTATAGAAISSARTVTVKVGGSGTATSGTDYAAVSDFDVTIAANATSGTGTFTLTPTQDTSVEGNETIGVAGTSALSRVAGTTVTLSDDDSYPAITLSANPSSVSEGASGTSVTVTATAASAIASARKVAVSVGGSGTATAGTDYATVADFTITIAANATSGTGTFTLTPTNDTGIEGNETIGVAGASPSSTVTGTTVTLTDDDTHAITLSASPSSVSESKASETVTVTAAINVALSSATTVTVSVGESTDQATSGTDYEAVSDFTVTIAANATSGTGTFTFKPKTDTAYEGFETVTISGSASQLTPVGISSENENHTNTIPVTATSLSIHDASNYPAVTLSAAPSSVSEDASATSVTVTATAASAITSSREVTVSVGGSGAATSGTDYAAVSNFIIKLAANATSATGTFTLSPTQDDAVEGSETIGVSATSLSTKVTGTTVTLTDDDNATLSVNDATAAEGSSMTFTVTLDTAVVGGLTVTPSYTNGTASSSDYTTNTTGISFSGTANERKTFTVSTTQDDVVEGNETFTVGLSVSGTTLTGRITSTDTGTGTISSDSENNVDTATLTINDASASEGESMTFTVTLSEAVQGGLTVTPSYTNGTAANGDYTKNTSALSFTGTKGETKTFTVSTTEDAVLEANETFTVGLSVSGTTLSNNVTSTDTGTGTINNDDSAEVTVNDASASEGESMTFTVTLSEAVQGGLTVTPDFTDGTAVEGTDFDENTAALSFSGTKGETKTFTVSTTEDAVLEANETFTVGLSVSGTTLSVTDTDVGTGTINNDDGATVTVNDTSASEGESMTFRVTLGAAVQGGLTVTPGYTNVTAASTDYTKNTTGISFSGTKGETKTFTVSTKEDAVLEGDETFTVGLTVSNAPVGTTVTATDTGTGTIENDDATQVTINDANADEGNTMTFTVTLSEAVQGGLTVTPGYTNVTAASTDYTANTSEISFSGTKGETQTFTVSTKEDEVVESNETFTVGLTVSDAPSGVTATDTGTGTITNDDGATVTVNNAGTSEGEAITFTVTLGAAVQGGLKVTPGYTDGTAASTDYTANASEIDFSGTKGETHTFTVSTTEDGVFEADETFTVDLTVSKSGIDATDTGTGTIDNDDSAEVTINDASANEGGDMTFTVTLDNDVQGGLTVALQYGGTATGGTDYTAYTKPLSFSGTKGETKSFTVSTVEDEVVEGDESITIALSVSDAPAGVTATDTGTGTIDDDDVATVSIGGGGVGAAGKVALSSAIVVAAVNAVEGAGISFTVTLDKDVVGGCSVTPVYTNVTASANDYVENVNVIAFAGTAGEQKTFTVWTTQDAVLEHAETFEVGVAVSGTTLDVIAPGDATGTIENDDSATVTINDASASEGESMTFTVTLSEAVQGGLTVTPGYTDGTAVKGVDYRENATPLDFVGKRGETRTFAVAMIGDGGVEADETFTVGLTLSNTTLSVDTDDVGTGTIINVDTYPRVTLSGPADVQNGAFDVTATFSTAVTGFESSDVVVGNGFVTALSGAGEDYTVTVTPAASGAVTVDVGSDKVVDHAGNGNIPANQFSVEADVDAPTVVITGSSDVQTGAFDVAIVFSEVVTGFESGDVVVGNGSVTAFSGGGESYTATITPSGSGTITINVPADVAHDAAGNGNLAAGTTSDQAQSSLTVRADVDAPTVVITGPSDVQTGAFDVAIAFSEVVTGFEPGDVVVGNGTVTAFSGADESYTAAIAPSESGTVTVDVGADVAHDAAGNGNISADQFAVEADLDAPTVVITGPSDVQTGAFDVAIAFSAAVTGFEPGDVVVGNGTVTAFSGADESYTAAIAPSESGTVTVDVGADVAHDAAGNGNISADQFAVEADLDAPTVVITGPSDVQTGAFDVAIAFSAAVTGFEPGDVVVGNGTVTAFSGADESYTAAIAPSASGTVTVDVPANAAHDAAGSGNLAAQPFSVTADLSMVRVAVSPTDGLTTTEAGGAASFTVALKKRPTARVVINVASADVTEGVAAVDDVTFSASDWKAPKTVTVTGVDDDEDDGDQTYAVVLSPAVSDDPEYAGADPDDVTLTNVDGDVAGITVTPTSGLTFNRTGLTTLAAGDPANGAPASKQAPATTEAGAGVTFTVVLDTRPTAGVTLSLSSSDPSEGRVYPEALTFAADLSRSAAVAAGNWNVPQTVTVVGVPDNFRDGNTEYTIILSPATSRDLKYHGLDPDDITLINVGGVTLSDLVLSHGALSPSFGSATLNYDAATGNAVETVTVTPTLSNPDLGALTINGATAQSGAPSDPIALAVGQNVIEVAVTNVRMGLTTTYAVTVTRQENNAPSALALQDQTAIVGEPFHYAFPEADDPDVDQTLTYSATLEGGHALPGWLRFDPSARAFSGAPASRDAGTVVIAVTATDNGAPPMAARATFKLAVTAPDVNAHAVRLALAAFGRTVASNAVEVLESRFAADGSPAATLGGRALTPGESGSRVFGMLYGIAQSAGLAVNAPVSPGPFNDGRDADALEAMTGPDGRPDAPIRFQRRTMDDVLSQSAFDLRLGQDDVGKLSPWAFWGQGVASGFSGAEDGIALDGRVFSAFLGLDRRLENNVTLGMAFSRSDGEMDYTRAGGDAGVMDVTLNNVMPYARYAAGTRLNVWGMGSAGWGTAQVADRYHEVKTDISMIMGALGLHNSVTTVGDVALAIKGDAFALGIASDARVNMPMTEADVQRLRVALEGQSNYAVSAASVLTPRLEIGGRWDRGSAETGLGAEVGGGIDLRHTPSGWGIETRGRYLLAHQSAGFEDWGASLALRFDPGSRERGLHLTFAPTWGQPDSRAEALWNNTQSLNASNAGANTGAGLTPHAFDLEIGHGTPISGGMLTSYSGVSASPNDAMRIRVGSRLKVGRALHFNLEGEHSYHAGGPAATTLRLRGRLLW